MNTLASLYSYNVQDASVVCQCLSGVSVSQCCVWDLFVPYLTNVMPMPGLSVVQRKYVSQCIDSVLADMIGSLSIVCRPT